MNAFFYHLKLDYGTDFALLIPAYKNRTRFDGNTYGAKFISCPTVRRVQNAVFKYTYPGRRILTISTREQIIVIIRYEDRR